MIANFIKVTLRNLYREKMYAVINIAGLSIAIACCLILGLWLHSELTYDRHNFRYKQIFRVVNEYNVNGKLDTFARSSISLGPMLAEEYPEIKDFVRFMKVPQEELVRHGDDAFYWKNHFIVDDNIFEVFTHGIIYGDPKTALVDPTSVAVSETFAKKYFGDANPIGETINTINETMKITLVFADLPENSHLKYDVLTSLNREELATPDSITLRRRTLFSGFRFFTYLLMSEDYDVREFKEISDSFYARHMAERGKSLNVSWRSWLQSLADIHLKSDVGYDLPTSNKLYLYGFATVAVFILLVACINYTNLATARAARRAREVGMQKILGAGRTRLIFQFLGESIFFSLIALFIGFILVEVALNMTPINDLLNKPIVLDIGNEPEILGLMLVFNIVVGLISGIYPAFYLSSMSPLSALVTGHRAGKWSIRLRQLLVLIQFIISVSVIAGTLLMTLQMKYIFQKFLGFNKENRVIVPIRGSNLINKLPTLKKELLKNSRILGVTECSHKMGQLPSLYGPMIDNNDGIMERMSFLFMQVGDDFLKVMGMELLSGRDFSKKLLTDVGSSFVVNEAMVKKMGWEEPLGKRIQTDIDLGNGTVIGVVKDFHFISMHSQIEPLILCRFADAQNTSDEEDPYAERFLVLNITGEEISRTLSFIEEKIVEFSSKHPFQFEFLDDSLDQLYLSEQRLMKLIGILAGVCIFISCMGLFGLAAFTTEQRTKEIGIRKVLGATTWQIITMLSRNILLLVLGGAIVASLIAYYAMDEWLTGFAYRIGINPVVFLLSAVIAAGLAFITIALQSYRTARANPVEALRYE